MNRTVYMLMILLYIVIVISVLLVHKCARLSKELAKCKKQTTNVNMFEFGKKNIKEINVKIEIPFEFSDSVTDDELKESLINEMHPELKSCLDYATCKDIATLTTKCRGRLRVVEAIKEA